MYGKGIVELLVTRTHTECGLDPLTIHAGSHRRIYVRCTRCNEEFLRERRMLHQLHNCPTRATINGMDHKWCNPCKKFVSVDMFPVNVARYDGMGSVCLDHHRIYAQERERARSVTRLDDIDTWFKWTAARKRREAHKHGISYDLDAPFLKDLWLGQDGRCAYSKVPLRHHSKTLYGAWLERVAPERGYVRTNVVWASKAMNMMKNNASLDEFREFISSADFITLTNVRFEGMRLHADGRFPERAMATDAAYDIWTINDVIVPAHGTADAKTGVVLTCPDGYYLTIEGRSSLFRHGIMPTRGIIDATYTGELAVTLMNVTPHDFTIHRGERCAQLLVHKSIAFDLSVVKEFSADYNQRGTAGFGSTGK